MRASIARGRRWTSQAKPGGQFYDVIRLKAEASVAGCCDGACWPPRR